uniref:Putative secreted protein ovary overexpressed n=1 Tax=Rhipicephalus microplus TaxID=6941 RepID=A0A6M2DBM6_RHIMP
MIKALSLLSLVRKAALGCKLSTLNPMLQNFCTLPQCILIMIENQRHYLVFIAIKKENCNFVCANCRYHCLFS